MGRKYESDTEGYMWKHMEWVNGDNMSRRYKREKIILLAVILFLGGIPFSSRAQDMDNTVSSGDAAHDEESGHGDADSGNVENSGTDNGIADSSVSDGNADIPEDVISVIIPTEFDLFLIYDTHNDMGYIQSQDIMIINKSDFPVDIKIEKIQYEDIGGAEDSGNREIELSCSLRQWEQPDIVIPVPKEGVTDPLMVELKEGNQNTNVGELLQEADKWKPTGPIGSADYAALRLEGTMGAGNWKNGDIKVQITYEFERSQDD